MLNTTERSQYWTSLFLRIILEESLFSIIVVSALGKNIYFHSPNCRMEINILFILFILRYTAWGENKLVLILINDNRAVISWIRIDLWIIHIIIMHIYKLNINVYKLYYIYNPNHNINYIYVYNTYIYIYRYIISHMYIYMYI